MRLCRIPSEISTKEPINEESHVLPVLKLQIKDFAEFKFIQKRTNYMQYLSLSLKEYKIVNFKNKLMTLCLSLPLRILYSWKP